MPANGDIPPGGAAAAGPAGQAARSDARPLPWLGIGCALLFLACELIAQPFAEVALCDDWSYTKSAELLAQTGHVVYNGWATAMLGWQLYAGAAMMRLFGASYTSARLSTLLIAALTLYLTQRILVRCGVHESNAAVGTLAVGLSPLFMELAASFMSDVFGMFAIVVCLYGCLRALQAGSDRAVAGWLVFAALSNALLGTARQIGWLGVLVMVPCTLWLLRRRRRPRPVLLVAAVATLAGWAAVFGSIHWFNTQPYAIPEHLFFQVKGLSQLLYIVRELLRVALEMPFLLLALMLPFLTELRRNPRRLLPLVLLLAAGYAFYALRLTRTGGEAMLDPPMGDWLTPHGFYNGLALMDDSLPIVLAPGLRMILTAIKLTAVLGLLNFLWRLRRGTTRSSLQVAPSRDQDAEREGQSASPRPISWTQLSVLLAPVALCYIGLLVPRASFNLMDRYLLALILIAAILLLRLLQDFYSPRLPTSVSVGVAVIALFAIADVHDLFAFDRARVTLTRQMQAAGIAPNHIDGGWEYNARNEVDTAGHVNEDTIVNPPHSFTPIARHRNWTCDGEHPQTSDFYPHLLPRYALAGSPDACAGPAPFAPVSYFRWLGLSRTVLYAVRLQPARPGLR